MTKFPFTIYFSDKKFPYGKFYPSNPDFTLFELQYNEQDDYKNSVLYLNYNQKEPNILDENSHKLKSFLARNGFSLFVPSTNFQKTKDFQKKLSYYYPEYQNINVGNLEITLNELNNLILSNIYLEQIDKKSGLLIPIETNSNYYYGTDLYGYIFIDITQIKKFSALKRELKKILPIVKINFLEESKFYYGLIPELYNRIFLRKTRRLLDDKEELTSVKKTVSGVKKIPLFDLESKIKENPNVYFSLSENKKEKNEIDRKIEGKYSEMLKKASAIKNNIEELAQNGFEELALMAIIKGLNISKEGQIKDLNKKIAETKNILPPSIENKWFSETNHQLSRLIITADYKILLADYGNLEIKLNPLHKSIYFLFLRHPEGIYFSKIAEYKDELLDWYYKLSNRKISDKFEKSIADICNPMENSLYEKLSRIKKEFIAQMDDRLAKMYYVTGNTIWDPKKINIPQELVIWEK